MKTEQDLYKITLYDLWCHPIADGTESFFTEDIEDFQKRWIKCGADRGTVERFLRSKAGEMVTDYYGLEDPDLNIVQKDTCTIYDEKEVMLSNTYFWVSSGINYKSQFHADRIEFCFKWIKFKEEYFRVTKVKALGFTECFYEKKKDCYSFTPAKCECNPVMEKLPSDKTFDIGQYSYNASDFAENSFESICYLLDIYFSKKERAFIQDMRNFLVTKRELNVLFRDFMGC